MKYNAAKQRRRGAVAVVVALCLIPLIGVLAFAFDGGILIAARRRAQTVADAAAYSAACQLHTNLTTDPTGLDVSGKAHTVALYTAKVNGYTNDSTTNTVTVNIPPQSGTHANLPGYAEVIVTSVQPRIFSAVLGSGSTTITARGVARVSMTLSASILILDPTASGALGLLAATSLTTQSVIQVNSLSTVGTELFALSKITTAALHLTGNEYVDFLSSVTTTVDKSVKTGVAAVPDPLASLPTPSPVGLTAQPAPTLQTKTIYPGVYNGGLTILAGLDVTMQPGLYYIKGGALTVAAGTVLRGTGVTIFMDNTSPNSRLSIVAGAVVSLVPPTAGAYAGLTYFQDRGNAQPITLGVAAVISMKGTVYAPAAAMNIAGGTVNSYGSQIIVDSLSLTAAAFVNITTLDDAKLGYVAATAPLSGSVALVE